MNISEARLKKIIKEEVYKKILTEMINEEIKALGLEPLEESKLRDKIFKGLGILGLMVVIGGATGVAKEQYERARDYEQMTAERAAEGLKEANTKKRKIEEFATFMNMSDAWRWGKGSETQMVHPDNTGDDFGRGATIVLPPTYSVAVQAYMDKMSNSPKFDAPEKQLGLGEAGDAESAKESLVKFFDQYEGKFIDATDVFDIPGIKKLAGSATESEVVMVNPSQLPANYVLPENGMTVEQYYNWMYYNQFLSTDEVREAKGDDFMKMANLFKDANPRQWKEQAK